MWANWQHMGRFNCPQNHGGNGYRLDSQQYHFVSLMILHYRDRQTSNEKAANTQYFALIQVHKKYCGARNCAKVTIKTNNTHNIQ